MLAIPTKLTIHWNWNLTSEIRYFSSKSEAKRYVKNHGIAFYEIENANENAAYDMIGREIHNGDRVMWQDPDPDGIGIAYYTVFDVSPEMIKMSNPYGECEALPEECKVVSK